MFGHNDDNDEHDETAAAEPMSNGSLATDNPAGVAGGDTGPAPISDSPDPANNTPTLPQPDEPSEPTPPVSGATATAETDDLLDIKKDALGELAPLVDHLDQSPEERFKTTMMMIQATDASGLIQNAYAAAKDIPDEKARAQALLDIVNEINYFTHANTPKED